MEIGIVGNGKMGTDIFNLFFQFDHQLVLICKFFEEIEPQTAAIEKQLKKMLSRGYLTDVEYEEKKQSFIVSNDFTTLKNCDLVIEAVFEDKALKRDIFGQLESIVNPKCILATNTSSIPLRIVFEECRIKDRCLGIHFFFPVKVTRIVEINKTKFTGPMYVEIVKDLLTKLDKSYLELKEEANMILTNIFSTLITQGYKIYEENYLTIAEIDKIFKEKLLTFGLFEVVDSTGINIIIESIENFIDERHKKLYTPLYLKGKKLLEEDYPGGTGKKGITDYEREHPVTLKKVAEAELSEYKLNIVLRLQSLLINELAFIINNQYAEKEQICEAVQEVLGLSENPVSMLGKIGKQKIVDCLLDNYQRLQDNLYQPLDFSIFDH
jgi:3-hydroxybutyryl-CoA dehydrogenase